jgi:hypothetical protein
MRLLNRFVAGLRALIWKNRSERELDEELRAYLDMAIEQKVSSGLSREAATRAARAEVGSVEAVKDHVRDVGWETLLDSFVQDLRFGVRSFLHTPRFTVPALLTLALGIGATAAIFSVIRTVMLEPLPIGSRIGSSPSGKRPAAVPVETRSRPLTLSPGASAHRRSNISRWWGRGRSP